MKRHCLFITLLVFATACSTAATSVCTTPVPVRSPLKFASHPRPDMTVDFDVFGDVGCPSDEYGFRRCNSDSPLATLDCDQIRKPSGLLGGLEPSYPIALCIIESYRNTDEPGKANAQMIAAGNYFYDIGDIYPMYVRYVIFRDGQFHLLRVEDEFRNVFVPIETTNEALSYVLATRNLSAYYGLKLDPTYEYFVDEIEDTHVDMVADGYSAHLYYYEVFGCGPHITYAVDMHITTQGYVEESRREAVYKNPAEDDLCVD